MVSTTQAKSALGQSATVEQGISQVPVIGVGTGSGDNSPESGDGTAPASGPGTGTVSGGKTCPQLIPFGQELPTAPPPLATLPPAPPLPSSAVLGVPPDEMLVAPPVEAYAGMMHW